MKRIFGFNRLRDGGHKLTKTEGLFSNFATAKGYRPPWAVDQAMDGSY